MAERVLRIGVLGLSRGFALMRPTFLADPRCRLVAAADPRTEARTAFQAEFDAPAYTSAEELCAWANNQGQGRTRHCLFGRAITLAEARVILRHPGRPVTVRSTDPYPIFALASR